MKRVACGISYDGTGYNGWQIQPNGVSIQVRVEAALAKIANHPIHVYCSGRTDKGVHAVCQVLHFDTSSIRDERDWVRGANTYLKDTKIRLIWAKEVSHRFHARFSALSRTYYYIIDQTQQSPTHTKDLVYWHPEVLDEKLMHEAAQYLVGQHDFSAFRGSGCQSKSPIRTIDYCNVISYQGYIIISIKANAFLYHMVRYCVSALIEIGKNRKPVHWTAELLDSKGCSSDRKKLVVASGLYFMGADYRETDLKYLNKGKHWLILPENMEVLLNG